MDTITFYYSNGSPAGSLVEDFAELGITAEISRVVYGDVVKITATDKQYQNFKDGKFGGVVTDTPEEHQAIFDQCVS